MTGETVAVHLLLAALLFFLMNWIGGHAVVTASYYQITYFSRYDDAPAFNLVFRVLAPVVFIVIASAVLYSVGAHELVTGIYLVVLYQQLLRWGYLAAMGRRLLVRWGTQVGIATATLALALLVYRQLISNPARLLPDFDSLANEVWLVVLIFLYKLLDNVAAPAEGNKAQKERYLRTRYTTLRGRFEQVIKESVHEHIAEPLVYAVMIYESFNRPTWMRHLEAILPRSRRRRSYGVMQVQSARPLSDEESVRRGAAALERAYKREFERLGQAYSSSNPEGFAKGYWSQHIHREAAVIALREYNVRSDYVEEVMSIHDFLIDHYYPDMAADTVGVG